MRFFLFAILMLAIETFIAIHSRSTWAIIGVLCWAFVVGCRGESLFGAKS